MKKTASVIHSILKCTGCEWGSEDFRVAEVSAKKHVEKTKHKVLGELGLYVTYSK